MGGAVSTGINNDDLIDNLLEADYIRTKLVENVFRAVDRGHYFLPEARSNAYKDLAWKSNHLHMSAPCIYTEVMEGLCLRPGLSFLNLGSGTGYLSTLVGLILGSTGVNHGIEIHGDVVQYAYKRLDEFRKQSGAIDEFDFCEPKFVIGNCLCLASGMKYDRVYCGAGCPPQYESYVKNLLKVGGILVMPFNEQLLQVKRISNSDFESNTLLPVSFATLISPDPNQDMVELLSFEPQSLQNLCRAQVRDILRKNIEKESPEEIKRPRHTKKVRRKERVLRRLAVPLFDDEDSSDEEQFTFGNEEELGRGMLMFRSVPPQNGLRENRPIAPAIPYQEELRLVDESINFNLQQEIRNVMDLCDEIGNLRNNEDPESQRFLVGSVEDNFQRLSEELLNRVPSPEVPSTSNVNTANRSDRHKLDSGLGDEIVERDVAMSSDCSDPDHIEVDSSSSSAEENDGVRVKRSKAFVSPDTQSGTKWRRINISANQHSSGSDSENIAEEEEEEDSSNIECRIMVPSPYTPLMAKKIQDLPLPHVLKKYLNYYKDF